MEYYTLVNHTREEKIDPHSISRGKKMYQWLSESSSSILTYLLLNGEFRNRDGVEYCGLWIGNDIELIGDYQSRSYEKYKDISQNVFNELQSNFQNFPEDMDSKFSKSVLHEYE